MSFLKNNWFIILIVLVICYLLFNDIKKKVESEKPVISVETVNKLDSLQKIVTDIQIDKAKLEEKNKQLEQDKVELESQLTTIQPKFKKSITDYKNATVDEKSKLYDTEFQKRKEEMKNAK